MAAKRDRYLLSPQIEFSKTMTTMTNKNGKPILLAQTPFIVQEEKMTEQFNFSKGKRLNNRTIISEDFTSGAKSDYRDFLV